MRCLDWKGSEFSIVWNLAFAENIRYPFIVVLEHFSSTINLEMQIQSGRRSLDNIPQQREQELLFRGELKFRVPCLHKQFAYDMLQ